MALLQSTYAAPRADLGQAFLEYDQDGVNFIADKVLAPVPVSNKKASFSVLTREGMLKPEDTKRNVDGTFNRVGTEAEDTSYECEDHGLEQKLDAAKRAQYMNDFDAELAVVRSTNLRMRIALERRVKALLFNTSTWTGAAYYTDRSSTPWDAAASDIIGHVLAGKEKVRVLTGMKANALVVGEATMVNMLNNTGIKARYQESATVTLDMLERDMAAIFGLEKLLVGGAVYDTKEEGLDASIADVWPDDYAMVAKVANENDPIDTPCIGRITRWQEMMDELFAISEYEEPQSDSMVYRVRQFVDEVIIDKSFGHLLKVDA